MTKQTILKLLLVAGAIAFLSGCIDNGAKSVDYYKDNLYEAKKRVEECKKLVGEKYDRTKNIDCTNAGTAVDFSDIDKPLPDLIIKN